MYKKNNKKKVIIIVSILIVLLIGAALGVFIYKKRQNSKQLSAAPELQNPQNTSAENTTTQSNPSQINGATNTTQSATSTTPSKPQAPVFTKSSGNNGSIPSNVLVEFVCSAEPGVDCQIILVNTNGQKINLPYVQVKDNGRGQYFASLQWTSQTGTWSVTAQAKNSQGGISSSEKQTLVVK